MERSPKTITGFEYIWAQYPIVQALVPFLTSPDLFALSTVSLSLRNSIKSNGALRRVSTHSHPPAMERPAVVFPDIADAQINPNLALDLPRLRVYINFFDTSYLTQLVLDGSSAGGPFVSAVVHSSRRLKLLSVKNCGNVSLATINRILDDRAPKTLETLMIWGIPESGWLWNEDTQGTLESYETRLVSRGIVAIIRTCLSQGIDLDTQCCAGKDGCRGLAWTLHRMVFDPIHPMFSHQDITRASIMMCEKRPIVCDSCDLVKDAVACLECMAEGQLRFGFCGECEKYICEECLDMFPASLFCLYCPTRCGECHVEATELCRGCGDAYCIAHEVTSQCPTCEEEFCRICTSSKPLMWRCGCGCNRIVCQSCQKVTRCIMCDIKVGGCSKIPYYRCCECMAKFRAFEDLYSLNGSDYDDGEGAEGYEEAEEGGGCGEKGGEEGDDSGGEAEDGEDGGGGDDDEIADVEDDGGSFFDSDSEMEEPDDSAYYF